MYDGDPRIRIAARAWLEFPPGTGWGDIASRKTLLEHGGYHIEEYRGEGLVMLSVRATPGGYSVSPPGTSPWWREPRLERAEPGALLEDTAIGPLDEPAAVELRDGSWVRARVTWQVRDRSGRWCVMLEMEGKSSGEEESGVYVFDAERVRRG